MSFSHEGVTREQYLQTQEQHESPSLLSPIDAYVLRVGMERLLEHLRVLPEHRFPQLVIFPDASARPLAYGIKALFEEVCAERGLALPKLRFMLTDRYEDTPGDMHRAERARELEREAWARQVLVVDDTLNRGTTVQQIAEAFASTRVVHIDYFAFYDTRSFGGQSLAGFPEGFVQVLNEGVTLEDIWEEFGLTVERVEEIIDRDAIEEFTLPPTRQERDLIRYRGFTYRLPEIHNHTYTKASVVGVEKHRQGRYAQRSSEADQERMHQLRAEILGVALRVVDGRG